MKLAALILVLLAGCSNLKVAGDCTYVREVKTHYHCTPDGRLEHFKLDHVDY